MVVLSLKKNFFFPILHFQRSRKSVETTISKNNHTFGVLSKVRWALTKPPFFLRILYGVTQNGFLVSQREDLEVFQGTTTAVLPGHSAGRNGNTPCTVQCLSNREKWEQREDSWERGRIALNVLHSFIQKTLNLLSLRSRRFQF